MSRVSMPAVNLVEGSLGLAVRQVLVLLGIGVVEIGVPAGKPGEGLNVAGFVPKLQGFSAGLILVNTRSEAGPRLCEALRTRGVLNPILDLAGRETAEAAPFLIQPWDGRLATLVRACLDPSFVTAKDLSATCRPFLERRLCHDLPKLIPCLPELTGVELVSFVREKVRGRPLLEMQLESFVAGCPDLTSAGADLRKLIERK